MTLTLPNAVSLAGVVGIIALCQGLADTIPVLGQPWVPVAVIVLGALAKALQVYLDAQKAAAEARALFVTTRPDSTGDKVRQWLIG